jgi:hypothetical protein
LNTLVSDNFPLSSNEFAESNPKYSDYIAALDKVCCDHYETLIEEYLKD